MAKWCKVRDDRPGHGWYWTQACGTITVRRAYRARYWERVEGDSATYHRTAQDARAGTNPLSSLRLAAAINRRGGGAVSRARGHKLAAAQKKKK